MMFQFFFLILCSSPLSLNALPLNALNGWNLIKGIPSSQPITQGDPSCFTKRFPKVEKTFGVLSTFSYLELLSKEFTIENYRIFRGYVNSIQHENVLNSFFLNKLMPPTGYEEYAKSNPNFKILASTSIFKICENLPLSSEFTASKLVSMTASQIYETYGTHYFKSAQRGSKKIQVGGKKSQQQIESHEKNAIVGGELVLLSDVFPSLEPGCACDNEGISQVCRQLCQLQNDYQDYVASQVKLVLEDVRSKRKCLLEPCLHGSLCMKDGTCWTRDAQIDLTTSYVPSNHPGVTNDTKKCEIHTQLSNFTAMTGRVPLKEVQFVMPNKYQMETFQGLRKFGELCLQKPGVSECEKFSMLENKRVTHSWKEFSFTPKGYKKDGTLKLKMHIAATKIFGQRVMVSGQLGTSITSIPYNCAFGDSKRVTYSTIYKDSTGLTIENGQECTTIEPHLLSNDYTFELQFKQFHMDNMILGFIYCHEYIELSEIMKVTLLPGYHYEISTFFESTQDTKTCGNYINNNQKQNLIGQPTAFENWPFTKMGPLDPKTSDQCKHSFEYYPYRDLVEGKASKRLEHPITEKGALQIQFTNVYSGQLYLPKSEKVFFYMRCDGTCVLIVDGRSFSLDGGNILRYIEVATLTFPEGYYPVQIRHETDYAKGALLSAYVQYGETKEILDLRSNEWKRTSSKRNFQNVLDAMIRDSLNSISNPSKSSSSQTSFQGLDEEHLCGIFSNYFMWLAELSKTQTLNNVSQKVVRYSADLLFTQWSTTNSNVNWKTVKYCVRRTLPQDNQSVQALLFLLVHLPTQ